MNVTPQKIKKPAAVLFDYDGVLVSSELIHLEAWMQLLKELNLPQDRQFIQDQIGKTAPQVLSLLLDHHRPHWNPDQYDVHELAKRKNVHYWRLAQEGLQAYPGVIEGLKWLHSKHVPLAVVSNGKRSELENTMKHLDIFKYFNLVVSRDDVNTFKPDPTPYLYAASCLNLKPENCIAIEDSPPGLEAALLAKVPTAAVLTNFSKSVLENPVLGRPDLKPSWIFNQIQEFFDELKASLS